MKKTEFLKHVSAFTQAMLAEVEVKNQDYSTGDDCVSHYKDLSAVTGMRPEEVWSILFMKHVSAILRYIRDGKLASEDIHHRCKDAANYCMLLSALVKDLVSGEIDDDPGTPPDMRPTESELLVKVRRDLADMVSRHGSATDELMKCRARLEKLAAERSGAAS